MLKNNQVHIAKGNYKNFELNQKKIVQANKTCIFNIKWKIENAVFFSFKVTLKTALGVLGFIIIKKNVLNGFISLKTGFKYTEVENCLEKKKKKIVIHPKAKKYLKKCFKLVFALFFF